MKSFGKEGSGDGEFVSPVGVCITGDGRFIVVTEFANSRIQVFTMDGEPVFKFGDNGPERLDYPTSCVCYEEKFFVTDKNNNCVKVFDAGEDNFCTNLEKKDMVMDRWIRRMAYVLTNITTFWYMMRGTFAFNSLLWKELSLERQVQIFNLDCPGVLPQC